MNNCGADKSVRNYLNTYYSILNNMIRKMTGAGLTCSISHNFIVQMLPHHRAAIEMSNNILKYTCDETLCNIAQQIIKEQTESIDNMLSIKCECSEHRNSNRDLCVYQCKMNSIMQNMFLKMQCAKSTNSIDCNFLREMIPHHMGAVEMAQNALKFNICSGLNPILKAIIENQKKGIERMQKLMKALDCEC